MPNWCRNEVIIRSTDYANLKRLLAAAEEGKLLELLRPYTKETNYEWDYSWCVDNWGTKWDTGEIIYAELSPSPTAEDVWELCIDFETAWSPPITAFVHGADRFDFEFDLYYMEEGEGFVGCANYTKDTGLDDECYELYDYGDELPSEEVYLDKFPYHIVEHFNMERLYADLKEYEEENA
jgi:hypothetical protein